jgi:two-component system, NtrC family, sensor kinase
LIFSRASWPSSIARTIAASWNWAGLWNSRKTTLPTESRCTVFTVKTPVTSEQGEVIGILVVFTDITERKRVEESLRESERQLRLAQKLESIGQLAAGIAHEINTPVQYIGDNAQFLSSAFQDLFRVIEQQPPAAGDATRTWTSHTSARDSQCHRANAGRCGPRGRNRARHEAVFASGTGGEDPDDIHQAIESTVLVSRNEWKYVADLTTDFDPEMPPVPCIMGEFNQVILNLIVNAAHAIADVVKEVRRQGRHRGSLLGRTVNLPRSG